MSMIVVTPPAAAARVALAKPSLGARLVHVHVRVDEPGQEDLVAGQAHDLTAEVVTDGHDAPVLDGDVAGLLPVRQQRGPRKTLTRLRSPR